PRRTAHHKLATHDYLPLRARRDEPLRHHDRPGPDVHDTRRNTAHHRNRWRTDTGIAGITRTVDQAEHAGATTRDRLPHRTTVTIGEEIRKNNALPDAREDPQGVPCQASQAR